MVNRVKRRVSCFPKATYYKPKEIPLCDLEIINLSIEELEAIRLCDLLHVEQNEAADRMGVSRKTFWNDLQKARQKVVDALVNGKAIEISGGEYVSSGECEVGLIPNTSMCLLNSLSHEPSSLIRCAPNSLP